MDHSLGQLASVCPKTSAIPLIFIHVYRKHIQMILIPCIAAEILSIKTNQRNPHHWYSRQLSNRHDLKQEQICKNKYWSKTQCNKSNNCMANHKDHLSNWNIPNSLMVITSPKSKLLLKARLYAENQRDSFGYATEQGISPNRTVSAAIAFT